MRERLTPDVAAKRRKVINVLQGFTPLSNVLFEYNHHKDDLMMHPTIPLARLREHEFGDTIKKTSKLPDIINRRARKEINRQIRLDRQTLELENVGGYGIRMRSLDEIDAFLPGAKERLLTEPGKIVIMGNGLSIAPLEVYKIRQASGNTSDITVVDLLNYRVLLRDLDSLKHSLDTAHVSMASINIGSQNCRQLLDAERLGEIRLISYAFGSGSTPPEVQHADLAINVMGPPPSTLEEQLQCLNPDGELLSKNIGDDPIVPKGYTVRMIRSKGKQEAFGWLIEKEAGTT